MLARAWAGGARDLLKALLGRAYRPATALAAPLSDLFRSTNRMYILYSLAFVAVACALYLRRSAGGPRTRRSMLAFCFPRNIYASPSAVLDYKFYAVNAVLLRFVNLGAVLLSMHGVTTAVLARLEAWLGPGAPPAQPSLGSRILYSFVLVLMIDLAEFVEHYIEHHVPLFWEFHKVHHSVTVLTPVSATRFHPVDLLLRGTLVALFLGTSTALFVRWTGTAPTGFDFLGTGVFFFLYGLSANLRHSHLWISYGPLSYVFVSPAQHQIHHSTDERHLNKNLGTIFAFWDYFAGTLEVPREPASLTFGLTEGEHENFRTVASLYLLPLKNLARSLFSSSGQRSSG